MKLKLPGLPTILFWFLVVFMISLSSLGGTESLVRRGSITGTVTSDQGQVEAFRVTARNLKYRIAYSVYTRQGSFHVPEALPGPYEVFGADPNYTSSTVNLDLTSTQNQVANLSVKKNLPYGSTTLMNYDEIYPPGPARDLLERTCLSCHNHNFFHHQQLTEAGWRAAIRMMRWGRKAIGPFSVSPPLLRTALARKDIDTLVGYLTENFGPESPKRELKFDPLPVREEAISKSIFVEYEIPELKPNHVMTTQDTHDVLIAADKSIWVSAICCAAILHLDQHALETETRWKIYQLPDPQAGPHGLAEDQNGHIYYADVNHSILGEIEPETGKITEHISPGRGTPHSLWTDRHGNIWFSEVRGGALGKYEPGPGRLSAFFPATPDPGTYQPTEDMSGNIWVPGMTKNEIMKFDPVKEVFTEYKTPTSGSGPRRSRRDYEGNIWFTETNGGRLGEIDPVTGRITEYRVPASNSEPYEIWFRKNEDGTVWASDGPNDTIFRFDIKTGKATFYPLPQGPIWAVRKVEVEANNTFWFTTITVKRPAVYHFYPEGYTATAPPEP